jgi:hypothetical protein
MALLGHLWAARRDRSFGNKAVNLAFLQRRLFNVPDTICVSWHAFERSRSESSTILGLLRQELVARIDASLLFEELVGRLDLTPESLARRFYCRAYFNMGAMGRVFEAIGMISHAFIIAREYGIPSVMSIPSACTIADGSIVSVDAFEGDGTVDKMPEEVTKP